MSLATRCTHCGTIFKVVQDQLKVSEGWVRCGRCHEIFNALPSLFDLEKDPPPPRPAHLPAATAGGAPATEASLPARADENTSTAAQQPFPAGAPGAPPQADAAAAGAVAASSAPPASPTAGPFASQAGVSIPLSAMPDVRQTAASAQAPASIPPTYQRDPLAEQGLLADPDVDLGFDTHPPSDWARTQPADIENGGGNGKQLDEDDLALDPAPIEATTDFELDTAIAVDDNTPLEAVLASVAPRQPRPAAPSPAASAFTGQRMEDTGAGAPSSSSSRAWLDEPPEQVPSTEEEDALDSRYLMPSTSRDRKPPRRLEEGPEFVDAQFPSDAFLDAEEDWASDFGPSALDAEAAGPAPGAAASAIPAAGALRPISGQPDDDDASGTSEQARHATHDGASDAATGQAHDEGDIAPHAHEAALAEAQDDGAANQPEFVRRANRKAFWRHPATRAVLSIVLLALTAALALQLTHQFRDLIAAYHPESRPLLARLCEVAGCEIKPPLRIEDLQVESATLVRAASEGEDSYRLAVVIHNRSGIGLAWPHVDLTLNDENGTVIARRVFSPQDAQWLDTADPKAEAPANGEANGNANGPATGPTPPAVPDQRSTTLQWRLLAPDIKPAGYTAELFYP